MRSKTTISGLIRGDDLYAVVVKQGVELSKPNASVLSRECVNGFLSMEPAQRKAALEQTIRVAGKAPRVQLTIPSSWCVMHPIALTASQWVQARDEIVRSIDRMLPLDPSDAEVGQIDLVRIDAQPTDGPTSGMLVGVARSRIEPWLTAFGDAIGNPVEQVKGEQIAAMGLGLQHEPDATVFDSDGSAHVLRWGRMAAIGELLDDDNAHGATCIRLTDAPDDDRGGPYAVAIASVLADEVTPNAFRPIVGNAVRPAPRWIAPAACAGLAVGLLVFASMTTERRYQNAVANEQQRQSEMNSALMETQELRLETERLTRLINDGVVPTINRWSAITPAMIEAQASILKDGTLHRLDLDGTSIALRGETLDAGTALGALEASASFTGAAFTAPVSKTPDGADFFELRADRIVSGAGANR